MSRWYFFYYGNPETKYNRYTTHEEYHTTIYEDCPFTYERYLRTTIYRLVKLYKRGMV